MTKHGVQAAVAVTPVVGMEERRQADAHTGVFIFGPQCCTVIKIAAAGKPQGAQQRRQRMGISQGISDLRLFPVCQGADADARVFFYYFFRLPQDIQLQLLAFYRPGEPGKLFPKCITFQDKVGVVIFSHGLVSLITDGFVFPFIQHLPADAHVLCDILGGGGAGAQVPDGLKPNLRLKGRAGVLHTGVDASPAGVAFIYPACKKRTAGVYQRPPGKGEAAAVRKVVVDGGLFLRIKVALFTWDATDITPAGLSCLHPLPEVAL